MKKDAAHKHEHKQSRKEPSGPSTQLDRNADPEAGPFSHLQHTYGNRHVQEMLRSISEMSGSGAGNGMGVPALRPAPVRVDLRPHSEPDHVLQSMAPVYAAGKTPVTDKQGHVTAVDIAPANAAATGRHLQTIKQQFGDAGFRQTIHGLGLTRGIGFAAAALDHAGLGREPAQAANVNTESDDNLAARTTKGVSAGEHTNKNPRTVSREVATTLSQVGGGSKLPRTLLSRLTRQTGDQLRDVRLHHDLAANKAAALLGARAFTLGRSIYFGAGEFSPGSNSGRKLVAHEVAHAVQQRGSRIPRLQELEVSRPTDAEEIEAERFSEGLSSSPSGTPVRAMARPARIHRAISFTHSGDTFTKNTMGVGETAAGFQIRPNAAPLFQWSTNITIHGSAGDPFANFEVGPLQVCRSLNMNFYWGTGATQGHRRVSVTPVPIRDSVVGNNWYADALVAPAFAANGDVRATNLNDSPQSAVQPWTNPVAGKAGNFGTFNYGASFVAYISARNTTGGFAAGDFRAIGNVYWNVGISGNFNAAHALGARVAASGGTVNRSGVIEGASGEFPSMHGGAVANNNFVTTDT